MKRLLTFLLALVMLLTVLVSCDKSAPELPPSQGNQPQNKPADGENQPSFDITEIIPTAVNYNNTEVTLCVRGGTELDISATLKEGTPLSAELFERTTCTEERLGVAIELDVVDSHATYNNAVANMREYIIGNQSKWDIIVGWSPRIPQLTAEGLFYNLNNLEYFDSENVWWSQSLVKELTINNRMFMATGDISMYYMENAHAVIFNQALASAIGQNYTTFYDSVTKGKWTFDMLHNLSKDAYVDLNGNSTVDGEDRFGLVIHVTHLQAFYGAAGISLITHNGVDAPEYNVNVTHLDQVWSKISKLLDEKATVNSGTQKLGITNYPNFFNESKALFLVTQLASLRSLTNMRDSFGVLPMPKYEEAQQKYYTQIHSCELWCVPMDAKDPDMSSAVMTSMGFDSHEIVVTPHIELLLKTRYVKDSESGYMIDTIYNNTFINFDSIYNEVRLSGEISTSAYTMPMFMFGALAAGQYGSVTAWWTTNQDGLKKELELILNGFYK